MALDDCCMQHAEHVRQLLAACEQGNVNIVQASLEQGLDVDSTGDDNVTALQVAAANNHDHLVRMLLMRGAALDKCNSYGWTPLMLAARHGHVSTVGLLLQNKADINSRTRLGASAITFAARGGHLKTCKLLVEAGIDMSPSSGIGGSTWEFIPLMVAAMHGHDTVVRFLLDRGMDINYKTLSIGINTLMLTAVNGHMTTAQILVERGADPNSTNVNSHTPLDIATIRVKREVHGYLDRKTTNKPKIAPEDVKPDIIEVAKKGDIQRLRDILEEDRSQCNACSPQDGATPLMFAAMIGRLDMAQLLVEYSCDINKQDTVSGWTALMQATYHGKKVVAKFLINAGADVLIPAKNGCTAFDMASLIDDVDTELYRLLAAKAVQINKPDRRSKTWSGKQNGTGASATSTEQGVEQRSKTGLKAWWSRMSNRFRNLKLGHTFSLSTNRLSPLPVDGDINDVTLKSNPSPKLSEHGPPRSASVDASISMMTNMSSISTITSYESIMKETRKSASMYTLGLIPVNPNLQDGNLKSVIPPFLPPPTFDTDRRPKMPPSSMKKSIGSKGSTNSLTRPVQSMKFLKRHSSTQNLNTSPPGSNRNSYIIPSPSSSGGASGLSTTGKSRVTSSASSSTLTGSDTLNRSGHHGHGHQVGHGEPVFIPGRPTSYHLAANPSYSNSKHTSRTRSSSHNQTTFIKSSHISPTSSTNESKATSKSHGAKSGSSKESTSTLTPSTSPVPKGADESAPSSGSHSSSSQAKTSSADGDDDLGGILKTLSLEGYQPIFEEQEVDMEAFLTLTDQDLKELGINQNEPRKQILSAITELNSGKGRERLHFHESMTHFQNTLSGRSNRSSTYSTGSDNYSQWNLQPGDEAPPGDSSKSRAS